MLGHSPLGGFTLGGSSPATGGLPPIDVPTFLFLDPQTTAVSVDPQLTAVTLDPQNTEIVIDG